MHELFASIAACLSMEHDRAQREFHEREAYILRHVGDSHALLGKRLNHLESVERTRK